MAATHKIILIRHGQIETPFQGRYIGSTDPGLSMDGIADVRALRCRPELARYGEIHVSPKLRTRFTAGLIFGRDAHYLLEPRLREIEFGEWDNLTFAEIERRADAEQLKLWSESPERMAFPGGESYAEMGRRIDSFLAELFARPHKNPPVLVIHGGVLNYILCKWRRLPLARQGEVRMPRGTMQLYEGEAW